jgi:hypothetical protein
MVISQGIHRCCSDDNIGKSNLNDGDPSLVCMMTGNVDLCKTMEIPRWHSGLYLLIKRRAAHLGQPLNKCLI